MTDDERGPGWWMASDGRWYPPEAHPAADAGAPTDPVPGPRPAPPERPKVPTLWLVGAAALIVLAGASTAVALQHPGPVTNGQVAGAVTVPPAALVPSVVPTPTTPVPPSTTTLPLPVSTTLPPPPAPTSGPLVTPQIEQQVVATTWQAFADAFAEDDVATMAATSTPSVRQVITGWFTCGCQPWPTASSQVSYSAPPQTGYPLSFYAELAGTTYDGTPLDKQVVFTQAAPSAPWLVAYLGNFVPGGAILGPLGENQQEAPPPVPYPITSAPAELSGFFESIDETGKVPALPSHFIDDTYLQQTVAQAQSDVANEIRLHQKVSQVTHTVVQMSPVFAASAGDVMCADVATSALVRSSNGKRLVQPLDESTWGHLLAPGVYTSVTELQRFDECFFEDGEGTVQLYSDMGGPYSITGQ